MKKLSVLILTSSILLFTSCLDLIQYNEIIKDTLHSTIRISMPADAASENAEAGIDKNKYIQNPDFKKYGIEVDFKEVKTEKEYQMIIKIKAPEKVLTQYQSDLEMPLVPFIDKAGQYIYVFNNENSAAEISSDDWSGVMAQAMMAPYKYRILFGGAKKPVKCTLISENSAEKLNIPVTELGSNKYTDFPLLQLFSGINIVIYSFDNNVNVKEATFLLEKLKKEREAEIERMKADEEKNRTDDSEEDDSAQDDSDEDDSAQDDSEEDDI